VNCVVSNCTFTKVHTGVGLTYTEYPVSNLTITACNAHDYMVWGIQLATSASITGSPPADYVYIHDNIVHDIGWAYGAGWTGFTSDSGQHSDGIYLWIGGGGVNTFGINGTNIDVYNNIFYDSEHTDSTFSAYIYIEGGNSANVYNNLFNLPNANQQANGGGTQFLYYDGNGGSNALLRFMNNTIVINQTNNGLAEIAMAWYTESLNNVWPSLHFVQAYNNICYDFCTNGATSDYLIQCNDTNLPTCFTNWRVNYNLYRSENPDGFGTWYQSTNETRTFGLSYVQSVGWESNGLAADPLFLSLTNSCGTNAFLNNYGLQAGSPAIGKGTNLTTLGLPGLNYNLNNQTNGRPATGRWNIGAY
jgi:hypothetical protein